MKKLNFQKLNIELSKIKKFDQRELMNFLEEFKSLESLELVELIQYIIIYFVINKSPEEILKIVQTLPSRPLFLGLKSLKVYHINTGSEENAKKNCRPDV